MRHGLGGLRGFTAVLLKAGTQSHFPSLRFACFSQINRLCFAGPANFPMLRFSYL